MGYTPAEIRSMTIPEFLLAWDGWMTAHGMNADERGIADDSIEKLLEMDRERLLTVSD